MFKLVLVVVAVLAMVVPTFAGHDGPPKPELNGTAAVTSEVGGMIGSENYGPGMTGSFGIQKSYNTSIAGFSTAVNGNEVVATTYGSSVGYTFGLAINGLAGGFQTGTYSASAWMSIPKPH